MLVGVSFSHPVYGSQREKITRQLYSLSPSLFPPLSRAHTLTIQHSRVHPVEFYAPAALIRSGTQCPPSNGGSSHSNKSTEVDALASFETASVRRAISFLNFDSNATPFGVA